MWGSQPGCREQTLVEVFGGKVSGQKMFRVQEDWFLGIVEIPVIGTRDPGQKAQHRE